jgi:hypothetical protein
VILGAVVIEELPLSIVREYWYPATNNIGPWVCVLVQPDSVEPWRGFFSLNRYHGRSWSLVTWEGEARFFVAAGGFGYWVDEDHPEDVSEATGVLPLNQAVAVPGQALTIAVSDDLSIHLLTPDSELWRTTRIGWDDLKITRVAGSKLEGVVWNVIDDRNDDFAVDLETREVRGGAKNFP